MTHIDSEIKWINKQNLRPSRKPKLPYRVHKAAQLTAI